MTAAPVEATRGPRDPPRGTPAVGPNGSDMRSRRRLVVENQPPPISTLIRRRLDGFCQAKIGNLSSNRSYSPPPTRRSPRHRMCGATGLDLLAAALNELRERHLPLIARGAV